MKDVKFVTFTLALEPGAEKNAVPLAEAEASYKEKYSDYTLKTVQVVSQTPKQLQLFMLLVKE